MLILSWIQCFTKFWPASKHNMGPIKKTVFGCLHGFVNWTRFSKKSHKFLWICIVGVRLFPWSLWYPQSTFLKKRKEVYRISGEMLTFCAESSWQQQPKASSLQVHPAGHQNGWSLPQRAEGCLQSPVTKQNITINFNLQRNQGVCEVYFNSPSNQGWFLWAAFLLLRISTFQKYIMHIEFI